MNPNLPNFESAAYRAMAPVWRYVDDLFEGSSAWIERLPNGTIKATAKSQIYLPSFSREHPKDYQSRLSATPYVDRFATAIRDFVGLILHNGVRFNNRSPVMAEHWKNIDNRGNSGEVFLSELAIAVMRRGHSFVLVDSPAADSDVVPRPYWVHVHAPQVKNWRSENRNGKELLSQVTIERCELVADGGFGEKMQTSYLVLSPGRYATYVIEGKGDDQKLVELPGRSGVHGVRRGDQIAPLGSLPLVPVYGGSQSGFLQSTIPLKTLADLNLTHYRLFSDHLNKVHLCCFPTPVRVGTMGEQPELVLGPGVTVDVPPGGSFFWSEPQSSSIEQSRRELEAIEVAMDFLGIQYLVKPSDRQAAMVSLIQAAKVESSLELFVRSFIAGVNQALAVHASLIDEPAPTVTLDTRFFAQGTTDPNLLQAYTQFFASLASLPPAQARLLLELAQRRGFLVEDLDLDAWLGVIYQGGLPMVPTH